LFEKELTLRLEESKKVDEQVNQTLSRARSPSPIFQPNQEVNSSGLLSLSSDLDDARRQAVEDSLAMYQARKR
jgi:hypothetical protein|tara:strand:+ start:2233 stop:2451 length:219 start_codon:yes stop_codon:yes gene_type:complete